MGAKTKLAENEIIEREETVIYMYVCKIHKVAGQKKCELKEAFSVSDRNDSGGISYEENEIIENEELRRYVHVRMICKESEQRRSILEEAFKVFDRDGDGYITADDVARVLRNMGERASDEGAKTLIAMADRDGDGRVNFDEYVEVMSSD